MTPTNKITFTTFIFLLYHVFYYRHHVMIKRIFFFFIFFATFNTSWSKEKKNHLVTTFTTPWPKVKTFFFFSLVTAFTTPWSREKPFFSFWHHVQYAMVTEKEIWFLMHHYFDSATIMKKILFYFTITFTMEISSYMILHLPTSLTRSLTCRKSSQTIYSLEKTCVT